MSQADDYFQHLLDDEASFDAGDLPADEFCIDDTTVDLTFADYVELEQTPDDAEPKQAA